MFESIKGPDGKPLDIAGSNLVGYRDPETGEVKETKTGSGQSSADILAGATVINQEKSRISKSLIFIILLVLLIILVYKYAKR